MRHLKRGLTLCRQTISACVTLLAGEAQPLFRQNLNSLLRNNDCSATEVSSLDAERLELASQSNATDP